jgi:hypothetical protein
MRMIAFVALIGRGQATAERAPLPKADVDRIIKQCEKEHPRHFWDEGVPLWMRHLRVDKEIGARKK